jgi:hypothetical protein
VWKELFDTFKGFESDKIVWLISLSDPFFEIGGIWGYLRGLMLGVLRRIIGWMHYHQTTPYSPPHLTPYSPPFRPPKKMTKNVL